VPGSWLEATWPGRRPLTTGVFPTTRAGILAVETMRRVKAVKRRLVRQS